MIDKISSSLSASQLDSVKKQQAEQNAEAKEAAKAERAEATEVQAQELSEQEALATAAQIKDSLQSDESLYLGYEEGLNTAV